MKKSLFFVAAASALMLTACSSENDVVQNATQKQTAAVQEQAVGFDIYTPAATDVTRAGLVGTMTTGRLQRSEANGGGFGVYAFLTEDADADGADVTYARGNGSVANVPNFMVNEKILWNNTNLGWYYNPLKYWPNETDNDSQTSPATMNGTNKHTDRLTFFAYAPYVSAGSTTGITDITVKTGLLGAATPTDPTIAWKATTADATFNPNEGVDLLWGVAPSGGLTYTAVNGQTITRNEGTPLLNMIKPDVNTSMKFLFQHALARFGINVVAAVDQVSPGGELDPNTKITINSLKITGAFGTTGELNLNNDGHPSVANWTKIGATSISTATIDLPNTTSITVTANNATPTNNYIAKNLRFAGDHGTPDPQPVVGVTTAKQDLLARSNKWYTQLSSKPAYNPAKQYFTESGGVYSEATATATITGSEGYYELSGNNYNKKTSGTINSPAFPEALETDYVTIAETAYPAGADPGITVGTTKLYTKDASDNYTYVCTYSEMATDNSGNWTAAGSSIYNPATIYYSIVTTAVPLAGIAFTYPDNTYYEAERNYLYVVPTNAALNTNFGNVSTSTIVDKLRTITVEIEYYITTEDSKLNAERAQTKNVIKKDVVLPSLANGKTYMLNLILGLTSVKIEAEVSDWKVENVQADLPQNTAE